MPAIKTTQTAQLPDNTVVIVLVEHLGDILACEPVVRYAKREYPGRPVAWVMLPQYAEALSGHPELDYIVEAPSLYDATEWAKNLPQSHTVIHLHPNGRKCSITKKIIENGNSPEVTPSNYLDYGGLLEAFTRAAGLPPLTDAPHYYFPEGTPPFTMPERYVVFHCKSNDIRRDWTKKHWLALYDFFAQQQIYVLEVGFAPILDVKDTYYKDMTHIRSIGQIAQVIKNAEYFVGIESSFAHLANALRIEGSIIAGAYAKWPTYMPYSGLYRDGKMVRNEYMPAWFVEPDEIKRRYNDHLSNLAREAHSTPAKKEERPAPCSGFPNKWQRLLIKKLHRPLVKRFAGAEPYSCLFYYPEYYYTLKDSPDSCFDFFYGLLRLLGPVPKRTRKNPF